MAEEKKRLSSELNTAKVEAAEAAEKHRIAEKAIETKMLLQDDELKRLGSQVKSLEETLNAARKETLDENAAREAAHARIAVLERQLTDESGEASLTTAAALEALNRLKEESEELLAESQQEVEESRAEYYQAMRQLKAAESRITQLQAEVVRLQKHEHALHTLLGPPSK